MGRAAERLHISQPPLSQAMMRLEETLGVELLLRTNRAIKLTEAGRVFLDDSRRLLEQQERVIANAKQAGDGLRGNITLGFVGSVSYEFLPRLLANFRRDYPEISFDLRELPSSEQMEELKAKRIDIGIVRPPLANAYDCEMKVVHRERMIAVLPKSHKLARMKRIPLAALRDEMFMIFPMERVLSLHTKTLEACYAAGFSPRVALKAWQMPTMVSLVAAGMGVALLPAQIRNMPHAGVIYREISDQNEHLELEIALAWRRDDQSRLRQRILDAIPKYATGRHRE